MPTPYDSLEAVLNTARVRLNDAIAALGGEVLTDVQQFTGVAINAAWRRLQELLANYGFAALNREVIYTSVPVTSAGGLADQGSQVYFDWLGYWDGTTLQAAPVFPVDMICPLFLEERVHTTTPFLNFIPMDQVFNGLPAAPKLTLNKLWEWRQERIYMPGASVIVDLRLRYAGFLADFTAGLQTVLSGPMTNITTTASVVSGANIANGNYIQIESEMMLVTNGGGTVTLTVVRAQLGTSNVAHAGGSQVFVSPIGLPVPLMRSLNSFAWFICSEIARARNDLDAGVFDQNAAAAAEQIWNREWRQDRSLFKGSEVGKMGDSHTPTKGPAGPRGGKE